MSEPLEALKKLIDGCSDADRKALAQYLRPSLPHHPLENDWGIDAGTILDAIRRSSDLTKRGVRGIIAEAVFEAKVLPAVASLAWTPVAVPPGDWPYDALLQNGDVKVRIQVKLQRLEKGEPKRFYPRYYPGELFVVEVQKTRTGKKRKRPTVAVESGEAESEDTRPYRFGEFDILAVNMHPATHRWESFRYTLGDWLLPRPEQTSLVQVLQPVSLVPNDAWTDDLGTCLEWFLKGEQKSVIELKHPRRVRRSGPGSPQPS